jgi:hypothetical protein
LDQGEKERENVESYWCWDKKGTIPATHFNEACTIYNARATAGVKNVHTQARWISDDSNCGDNGEERPAAHVCILFTLEQIASF